MRSDVFATIEAFIDLVPERLAEGKIVRIANLEVLVSASAAKEWKKQKTSPLPISKATA